MGSSCSAELAYGICLDETSIDDMVTLRCEEDDSFSLPDGCDPGDFEVEKNYPLLSMSFGGSYDYSVPCVIVQDSSKNGWNSVEELGADWPVIAVSDEGKKALDDFWAEWGPWWVKCQYGDNVIEPKAQWLLIASYG